MAPAGKKADVLLLVNLCHVIIYCHIKHRTDQLEWEVFQLLHISVSFLNKGNPSESSYNFPDISVCSKLHYIY